MESKICTKCKIEKPLSEFYKRTDRKSGYTSHCKECRNIQSQEYQQTYIPNPDSRKTTYKKYYQRHIKEVRDRKHKKYLQWKNSASLEEKQTRYRKSNNHIWHQTKGKIASLLRRRMKAAIKASQTTKSNRTMALIGCDIQFLKNHLQRTALQNGYVDFDINRYSGKEYHIDHIIPCASFNLKCSYHQILCFNWSNLQILKAEDNIIKGKLLI